jgi:TPR repeat protein
MTKDKIMIGTARLGRLSGFAIPLLMLTLFVAALQPAWTQDLQAGSGDTVLDDYRQQAEAGDTTAMLRLGYHYLGAVPLPVAPAKPDPRQAVRWLTMAAEHKNAAAACALASYYQKQKNTEPALRFARQAAVGGDPACMYKLGVALLNGNGVAKNPTEAAAWIGKAAKAGLVPARYQDAKLHLFGIGVERDLARAQAMFLYLADRGLPGAMFYASMLLFQTQPQQALAWNQKAAEAGHTMAMYQLGTLYLSGDTTAKVAKNQAEARRWYAKAATAGEPESMLMLADMMEHGVGGPRDSHEAARWMMKALRGQAIQIQGLLLQPQNWSPAFWMALQTKLKEAGVYKGRIDGRFTKATLQAIVAVIEQSA